MTGDSGDLTTGTGQYAFEKYSRQDDSALAGLFGAGLHDLLAASKALAAAQEAHALALDPHAIDTMIKKLTEMQDELEHVQRRSNMLTVRTPLGGGYAEEIGATNGQIGLQAVSDIIPDMVKAIIALKEQVEKSRASYRNVDEASARTQTNLYRNTE